MMAVGDVAVLQNGEEGGNTQDSSVIKCRSNSASTVNVYWQYGWLGGVVVTMSDLLIKRSRV